MKCAYTSASNEFCFRMTSQVELSRGRHDNNIVNMEIEKNNKHRVCYNLWSN